MTNHYAVPGVYIEEQSGPGVIAGVSTSVAAFVGPALRGPVNDALRISSYDEFLEHFAIEQPDGTRWPFITDPRNFYLAHGVRGFFTNGGSQAYIVRVGTARATQWIVNNQAGEPVFKVQALEEGVGGDAITVNVQATHATTAAGINVATGSASVTDVAGLNVTLSDASSFRLGDSVTEDESARATITEINGNVLTLSATVTGLAVGDTLRIANILPSQNEFRLTSITGLWPGSVVIMSGDDASNPGVSVSDYAVVESVDTNGIVKFSASPARTNTYNLDPAAASSTKIVSQEFQIIITPPATSGIAAESHDNLSLSPMHPRYIFSVVDSNWIRILAPDVPPTTSTYPQRLVNASGAIAINLNGQNDNPTGLSSVHYTAGLNVLRDIDDVNILSIPDAAAHPERNIIQQAMINHCLLPGLKDRFAILDSVEGAPPSGPGSVELHRQNVQAEKGFAALYYPWFEVRDPTSTASSNRRMNIPPSGHIAGVYARTDAERGVHKAPANTSVRGVLGLERILSDGQHGPLNLAGVNALRIFPGSASVMVWGGRTTVDPAITDWLYVNVRRLMLYIEESIEEGIRWAVFEPNNLALWQKLKRTINEFLTRVWRDGALFGATADQAFYVRIDEALNPPSTRALGQLHIEIGVAPVRPAEFVIVQIGLWDGGSEVAEV